jgi:hypothetical protein
VSLDHEAAGNVAVEVTVSDAGGLTYSESFNIEVTDANEAPTDLNVVMRDIPENAEAGTVVGQATAINGNVEDNLTYSLDDDADGLFVIDGETGAISIADGAEFNYEDITSYQITVTATDEDGLSISTTTDIEITDVNETPTDIEISNLSVGENEDGAVVGDISVVDPDAGDTFTYAVSDDRFEVVEGQLKLKEGQSLDHEAAGNVAVEVTVSDAGGLTYSESFNIEVTDANEAPTDIEISNLSVGENEDGAVVGDISVVDPDAGDTFTYAVSDDRFEVVEGQLKLKEGQSLDHEAAGNVAVEVTVSDAGGLTYSESFNIEVTDANEAPDVNTEDAAGNEDTAIDVTIDVSNLEPGATNEVVVSGVPTGAVLSAGTDNGDGTWTLSVADTDGLTITPAENSDQDFTLNVDVSSTENGETVVTSASIDVSVAGVADAPTLTVEVTTTGGGGDGDTGTPETQVNTTTEGDQKDPTVTALADGGYVVVWESEDQDGDDEGVYGQRYDADGEPVGGEFQVNTETDNGQKDPVVTGLADGGFVVAWESKDQDGDDEGIYGQRYDADGNQVGGEFQINTETDGHQKDPQITSMSDGGFIVVWESNEHGEHGDDGDGIYGQRFDANGEPVGGEFQVNTETDNDQKEMSVTELANGGFVVVWESKGGEGDSSGSGVFGQQFDADGNPVGGEFQVNTEESGSQDDPVVTALSDGGFVVAWESKNQDGSGDGVFGQRFDADGEPVGGEFQVNTETDGSQKDPAITETPDGGFVVVWTSKDQDGDKGGVFGQRFDADGNPVGDEFQVNTETDGSQSKPSVDVLDNGNIVVSWQSEDQDGDDKGIFTREIDLDPDSGGEVTISLDITASLTDTDGSETLSIVVGGVPLDATLSAGIDNGDGTWILSEEDLSGLTITPAEGDETDFEITVTATSSESGTTATTTATVEVVVGGVDGENEGPTDLNVVMQNIPENAEAGTVVGQATAIDQDAGDNITYSLADDAGGLFVIDAETGAISIADGAELNYEEAASHQITVTATDDGGLSTSTTTDIEITDVNETPTDIEISNLSVGENEDGAVVGDISVVDPDAGESFTYAVNDDRFEVVEGQLKLKEGVSLDHEEAGNIAVEVTVSDAGGLTYSESFNIEVTDENETITDLNVVMQNIPENAEAGTVVGQATAIDQDAGDNITYSLADDAGGLFVIDAETGAISIADGAELNYEEAASHQITVTATDDGGLSTSTTTDIEITDVNETPTDIEISNLSVGENEDGAVVGDISVVDPDAGESFTYAVNDDRFEVVEGQLKLKEGVSLDHEEAGNIAVEVTVSDAGGLTYSESFNIEVTDANEAPTDINLDNISIDENSAGAVVGNISVVDPDAGDSVTYALSDERFEVVEGQLKLKEGVSLNHEAEENVSIELTATDSAGNIYTENFNIEVADVNEAPTNLVVAIDTFDDDIEPGTVVGQATADDPDVGDALAFSLDDDGGGRFVIDALTGEISVADGAEFDDDEDYSISVRVTDEDGLYVTQTQAIDITDDNDAPESEDIHSGPFAEDTSILITEEELLAKVHDKDSETFSITAIAEPENGTLVDNNDGTWTYTPDADYNGSETIEFTISDNEGGFTSANLHLTVTPEADDPVAIDDVILGTEDTPVVISADALLANDTDVDGDSLSIVGFSQPETGGTVADNGDGTFTFTPDADFVGDASFEYTVSDGQGGTSTATATVSVAAEEDAPTDISIDNLTIEENAEGAVIGSLSVTDADAGDTHTYTVSDDRFEVVEGQLKLKEGVSLDHEEAGNIAVEVTATDLAGNAYSETLTIEVADVNEEPTDIQLDNAAIAEGVVGAVVGDISVVDPDAGDTHTYAVSDDRFEVVEGQLKLKEGVSLDHEDAASVSVEITATDEDGFGYTETFNIEVGDVNEAPTEITLDNLTIEENAEGAVIGTLDTTDQDSGETFTYAVSDDRFEVVEGQLKLKEGQSLDHETEASVSVDVTATDAAGATYTESFAIEVTDTNEAATLATTDATGNEDAAISLDIDVSNLEAGATNEVVVSGVPDGATLSAGQDNGDGTWTLSVADTEGLTVTPAENSDADFSLSVDVNSTQDGTTVTTSDTIDVTVDGVADGAAVSFEVGSGSTFEAQVNTTTQHDQKDPSVTTLSDGGYVVAWESKNQDGDGTGVYGQRFDENGDAVGGEFQVNSETDGDQGNPSITALADGGYVVAWESEDQDGDEDGVYAQRYDSDGNTVGSEFQINSETDGDQSKPTITAMSDGGFVAVWESEDQDGDDDGVYGQRFDANGDTVGGEFQISSETDGDQKGVSLTETADGGFVAVWESKDQDGDGSGVYGQQFDADGDTVGDEFQVNSETDEDQKDPSVTALSGGGFVVVWESEDQDGDGEGVYGQRYDANGDAVGGEFQVNTETDGKQKDAAITETADGGFVVVWASKDQDGDGEGVYGQKFDANGDTVGGEFQVNIETDDKQSKPSVDSLPNGNIIVSWESKGQDGHKKGIFSREINTDYPDGGTPVNIEVSASDSDGSEGLSITVADVPDGATLSAGVDNGDGTWTLAEGDLDNLLVTQADGDDSALNLTVTVTTTEDGTQATSLSDDANDIDLGSSDDILFAGGGDDLIDGGAGEDVIYGEAGADTIDGGSGDDTLFGGAGDDILTGGSGDDIMFGGSGNDLFLFGEDSGNDTVSGGAGYDEMDISAMAADQGWTVVLDDGSEIAGQGNDYLELTSDSSGSIQFEDGSSINFDSMDKISFG